MTTITYNDKPIQGFNISTIGNMSRYFDYLNFKDKNYELPLNLNDINSKRVEISNITLRIGYDETIKDNFVIIRFYNMQKKIVAEETYPIRNVICFTITELQEQE